MIPFLRKYFIKDYFLKFNNNQLLFFPYGRFNMGKAKAYILESKHDLEYVYTFLEKYLIYSILFFVFVISFFIAITIKFNVLISWLIATAIGLLFQLYYNQKVKKLMKGFDFIISSRDFSFFWFIKINWRVWLFSFVLILFSISLGLLFSNFLLAI